MNRISALWGAALFLALGGGAASSGQTQLPASAAGGGGAGSDNGDVRLSAAVGQAVIGTVTAPGAATFQGFFHPYASRRFPAEPNPSGRTASDLLSLDCAPNPVSGSALLTFSLPSAGYVRLELYDVAGRLVRRLMEGEREGGNGAIRAALDDLPSGCYTVLLSAEGARAVAALRLID